MNWCWSGIHGPPVSVTDFSLVLDQFIHLWILFEEMLKMISPFRMIPIPKFKEGIHKKPDFFFIFTVTSKKIQFCTAGTIASVLLENPYSRIVWSISKWWILDNWWLERRSTGFRHTKSYQNIKLFIQISRFDGCKLKRIDSLSFYYRYGACKTYQFSSEKILFCFGGAVTDKTCHTWESFDIKPPRMYATVN